VRLAAYTDYEYRTDGTRRYGQRAFVVFMEQLREHVDRLVLVGRIDPRPGTSHYPLHEETELVGLPHYESLADPLAVARSLLVSVGRFWRLLGEVDTVWVLGPYPHAVLLAPTCWSGSGDYWRAAIRSSSSVPSSSASILPAARATSTRRPSRSSLSAISTPPPARSRRATTRVS
jgi:hypothetical protein